jgi:hypothetical protein
MSWVPPRAASCLALIAIATALIWFGVLGSYPGPTAPQARSVDCPASPSQLAGRHFAPGDVLPDLRCADLTGAVLDGMDLTQASLTGVHAQRASFQHVSLIQADLTGADLRGAVFVHADLGQATLVGADLRNANLTWAGLIQANLNDADLRGASLWLANSIQATTWSTRIGPVEWGVVQVPALVAVVLLVLMIFRALRFLLGPPQDYPAIRKTLPDLALRLVSLAAGYLLTATVAGMMMFNLAGLWITRPVPSLVTTGGVFLLAVVLKHIAPGDSLEARIARRLGLVGDPPRPAML